MSGEGRRAIDWARARERLAQAQRAADDYRRDAGRIEAAYAERAERLARPPEASPGGARDRQTLVFRLGCELCAAPLSAVERVIPNPVCTGLPGAGGNWAGVTVADGGIVPVLDLARALALPDAGRPARANVLKLRGGGCGLLVGEALEIRGVPPAELRPLAGSPRGVAGVGPAGLLVLDLESLLAQELSQ